MKMSLSDAEFDELRQLLGSTAGLVFDDSRRDALAFCVSERVRLTECADVRAYLQLLARPESEHERQALLDEVTIPETHFFRNPPQIAALRRHVLPQLLRDAVERDRKLTIWSAGCSTGEEPYTLAMLIRELLPLTHGWDIRIIATDISRRGLATAKAARYNERSLVMTEPADIDRFFTRDLDGEPAYVVRPEITELVEFRRHNLVTEPAPFAPGEVDLILCRNVTIYFDRETTRALVGRLHDTLRDGGYLFLGHAETLWQVSDDFHLVTLGDAFVYRRDDEADKSGRERRSVLPDRRAPGKSERWGVERRQGRERRTTPAPARPTGLVATIGRVLTTPIGPSAPRPTPRPAPPAPPPATTSQPEPAPVSEVRRLLAAGRYAEAVETAESMAQAEPLAADAHYLRGLALTNLGRDAEALIDLRKAIYLDPGLGFAHFLLAGALARLGESVAAVRSYRAAAEVLERVPDGVAPEELGGRSAAELAALCRQLADRAERHGG